MSDVFAVRASVQANFQVYQDKKPAPYEIRTPLNCRRLQEYIFKLSLQRTVSYHCWRDFEGKVKYLLTSQTCCSQGRQRKAQSACPVSSRGQPSQSLIHAGIEDFSTSFSWSSNVAQVVPCPISIPTVAIVPDVDRSISWKWRVLQRAGVCRYEEDNYPIHIIPFVDPVQERQEEKDWPPKSKYARLARSLLRPTFPFQLNTMPNAPEGNKGNWTASHRALLACKGSAKTRQHEDGAKFLETAAAFRLGTNPRACVGALQASARFCRRSSSTCGWRYRGRGQQSRRGQGTGAGPCCRHRSRGECVAVRRVVGKSSKSRVRKTTRGRGGF